MDPDLAVGVVTISPLRSLLPRQLAPKGGLPLVCAAFVLLAGCAVADTPPDASGVAVVRNKTAVQQCVVVGVLNTAVMTFNLLGELKAQTKRMGGDTLLMESSLAYDVGTPYVCDRERVSALRDRAALLDAVRVTNRQDVVSKCRFIKNAVAASDHEVRLQTVELGGDTFFVISDTARTETTKEAGSRTAYTYEVRRLTGEVYRCTAAP